MDLRLFSINGKYVVLHSIMIDFENESESLFKIVMRLFLIYIFLVI